MASFTVHCPKLSSSSAVRFGSAASNNANDHNQQIRILNLASDSPTGLPSVRFQLSKRKHATAVKVKASLNEVTIENSSKSAPKETNGSVTKGIADEASISAFMAQVTDLIKLVDAKDITELNLKQQDIELSIKKKEAFQAPAVAGPVMSMPPSFYSAYPSPPAAASAPALPPPSPAPASSALPLPPPAAKKPSSSHPPMKCPMAGTFYRSPAPGEPPFVKVGDKVQKGQVVCIIEAMKLMNEIEADQSGTIVEILLDDGKPVSINTPLFVIAP